MAAYSAVLSLSRTLGTILASPDHGGLPISLKRSKLESLREKVSSLQQFLENSLRKTGNQEAMERLEEKIRELAWRADDLIESHISNLLLVQKLESKNLVPESQTKRRVPEPGMKRRVPEPETKRHVPESKTERLVPEPETKSLVPELETKRYQDQDPVRLFLFYAGKSVLVFILVQNLLHFVVKNFVPVALQSVIFNSVQIVMSVAVILNLTYFLSKNEDFRTISAPPLVVGEMESRNVKDMESVDVRNVQFNSRQEDENLHKKIEVVEGMEFNNVKNVKSVDIRTVQFNSCQEDGNLHKEMEVVEGMESCRNVKNVKPVDSEIVQRISDQENEDLQMIIEKVGSIVKKLKKIKDGKVADDQRTTRNLSSAGSSSTGYRSVGSGKNVVVGFERHLAEIKARLTGGSSKLEIVPIVGMGGIGKTTLARQVYDESYMVYHFDMRAWVTISQEYSLRQVLVGLLDSAKILTEDMYEKREEELVNCLHKSLVGRRYLIVMDDIWDTEIWDAVRRFFPNNCNGSRVLLTTRLSDVALYVNSFSPLHKMQFLKEDESWNLLCKKVYGEKDCPDELKHIGKEIARNCGGLPLAIVVISGLLSKESRREDCWKSLAVNLNSIVTKDDEQCLEILGLSYNRLPHHLRACFLYLAVFPEDYEIPVCKLIRLWAAEGFLKPDGSKSLEELAEEYLDDLIERNLILVAKRSANGKIRTCNIHDLLRILCLQLQIARKEMFLYIVKRPTDVFQQGKYNSPCRLSIHPNFLSKQTESLYGSKVHSSRTRSLLCTGARLIYPSRVYLGYRLLRVLDLIIVRFFNFPAEIIKLVSLRYLAFTYNDALPPSISELQNLQTLVYHNWTFGKYPSLPVEIWMMPKLRHLCVTPCSLHVPRNVQMLVLENLHTLSEVWDLSWSNDVLKRIPNLKVLGISYNVSSAVALSEFRLHALVNLRQLETLKLLFTYSSHTSQIVNPTKLAFPEKLKRLTLAGCGIPWSSMTIVGALPNLEVLKLRKNACQGTEWEPVEEQFCQLKHLLLEEVDLVRWEANETHFPRLQRLILRSCYKLKEIPSGIGEIPTLQMIELVDCHHSAVTSAEQIQEEQEGMGNEELKVRIDLRRYFKNKFYSKIFH